jgi:hypothetical protein
MTYLRGYTVVMQSPREGFPFLWPPATNGQVQSLQNLSMVTPVHCSTFRDVLVVNSLFLARRQSPESRIVDARARITLVTKSNIFNILKDSTPFSPSLAQNLVYTTCSFSSDLLSQARNATRHWYTCSVDQSWRIQRHLFRLKHNQFNVSKLQSYRLNIRLHFRLYNSHHQSNVEHSLSTCKVCTLWDPISFT